MFKEKYKKDMNRIGAPPAALEKAVQSALQKTKAHKNSFWAPGYRKAAAAVLAGVFLLGAVSLLAPALRPAGAANPFLSLPVQAGANKNRAGRPIVAAQSYAEVYNKISTAQRENGYYYPQGGSRYFYAESRDMAAAPMAGNGNAREPSSSNTNNQVAGVQEADVIKNDGTYIYALRSATYLQTQNANNPLYYYGGLTNAARTAVIFSAENGQTTPVAEISIRESAGDVFSYQEILLYKNRLILIKTGYQSLPPTFFERLANAYSWQRECPITAAEIYDISNPAKPVLAGELYQSGSYLTTRMIENHLYVLTSHSAYGASQNKAESYVPYVSAKGEKHLLPPSCIFVPENAESNTYTVITGADVLQPANHVSAEAVLGVSGTVYASENNVYVAGARGSEYFEQNLSLLEGKREIAGQSTDIYRFSLQGGKVSFAASGWVEGQLINQFAMDEYEGALRLATTLDVVTINGLQNGQPAFSYTGTRYSNLYVLDLDLNITGTLSGLGQTERIYSVRFDKEVGYVVTFRETDPLYTVDLADKTRPSVLSELKIPGFSTYMHPFGSGLLLGFGRDASESGGVRGMKLSMFDVSNKAAVTEAAFLLLEEKYQYSSALTDHKAILVSQQKNLIGLPVVSGYSNNGSLQEYLIFSYEEGAFVPKASLAAPKGGGDGGTLRGLYVGDYFYVYSTDTGLISYNLSTFAPVGQHLYP